MIKTQGKLDWGLMDIAPLDGTPVFVYTKEGYIYTAFFREIDSNGKCDWYTCGYLERVNPLMWALIDFPIDGMIVKSSAVSVPE